jgi:hypothetical protein
MPFAQWAPEPQLPQSPPQYLSLMLKEVLGAKQLFE